MRGHDGYGEDEPERHHTKRFSSSRASVFMYRFTRTQPLGLAWRELGRTREAFLMLDKGIAWAETLSLGAWAPGRRRTERFPSRVWVLMCDFTKTDNGCGACRRPRRRVTLCLSLGLLDVSTQAIKAIQVGGLA